MAPHGLTHAQPARGIQRQAVGALAAEGASSVEAVPVGTDPGEDLAFIYIWAGTEQEEGKAWSCSSGTWDSQVVPWEVGRNRASLGVWGTSGADLGTKEGKILSRSQDFRTPGIPHDLHLSPYRLPGVGWGPLRKGWELPSQVSPAVRAKPWAQAGSVVGRTRVGTGVTLSIKSPVL